MSDIPTSKRILLAFDEHDFTTGDQEFLQRIVGKGAGIKVGSVPMHARLKRDRRITVASAVGSFLQNFHRDAQRMDDPKLFEIPYVMGEAARAIADSGAWGFTVHESNNDKGLEAAIKNCGTSLVIGVGILTSFSKRDSSRSFGELPDVKALDFAQRFAGVGGHALVCSGQDLEMLNQSTLLRSLIKIVPGIRDSSDPPDDQMRTMTAFDAIVSGADYLVIGRPIRHAVNPEEAFDRFVSEIERGLAARSR